MNKGTPFYNKAVKITEENIGVNRIMSYDPDFLTSEYFGRISKDAKEVMRILASNELYQAERSLRKYKNIEGGFGITFRNPGGLTIKVIKRTNGGREAVSILEEIKKLSNIDRINKLIREKSEGRFLNMSDYKSMATYDNDDDDDDVHIACEIFGEYIPGLTCVVYYSASSNIILVQPDNGISLFNLLLRENRPQNFMRNAILDTRHVYQIAVSLLTNLVCIHSNGIIHRDLKPENVTIKMAHHNSCKFSEEENLLDDSSDLSDKDLSDMDMMLYLIDYGLATDIALLGKDDPPDVILQDKLHVPMESAGTPEYMPEEGLSKWDGRSEIAGKISCKTDVYAAGRMLGEILGHYFSNDPRLTDTNKFDFKSGRRDQKLISQVLLHNTVPGLGPYGLEPIDYKKMSIDENKRVLKELANLAFEMVAKDPRIRLSSPDALKKLLEINPIINGDEENNKAFVIKQIVDATPVPSSRISGLNGMNMSDLRKHAKGVFLEDETLKVKNVAEREEALYKEGKEIPKGTFIQVEGWGRGKVIGLNRKILRGKKYIIEFDRHGKEDMSLKDKQWKVDFVIDQSRAEEVARRKVEDLPGYPESLVDNFFKSCLDKRIKRDKDSIYLGAQDKASDRGNQDLLPPQDPQKQKQITDQITKAWEIIKNKITTVIKENDEQLKQSNPETNVIFVNDQLSQLVKEDVIDPEKIAMAEKAVRVNRQLLNGAARIRPPTQEDEKAKREVWTKNKLEELNNAEKDLDELNNNAKRVQEESITIKTLLEGHKKKIRKLIETGLGLTPKGYGQRQVETWGGGQVIRPRKNSRKKYKTRKSIKRKSIKRKSIKRKSTKRKSIKRKSIKRKSIKRKSIKRKSIKRKSIKRKSRSRRRMR